MKAAEWIDRVKVARGWESDYRVAQELDLSHSTLSRYRTKPESTMDDDAACKVAAELDLEPVVIIMDQVAERTRSEVARASVTSMLARFAPKKKGPLAGGEAAEKGRVDIRKLAAVAAVGVAALASAPQPVQAESIQFDPNTHRINRRRRNSDNSHSSTWQLLAAAIRSMLSYGPGLAGV